MIGSTGIDRLGTPPHGGWKGKNMVRNHFTIDGYNVYAEKFSGVNEMMQISEGRSVPSYYKNTESSLKSSNYGFREHFYGVESFEDAKKILITGGANVKDVEKVRASSFKSKKSTMVSSKYGQFVNMPAYIAGDERNMFRITRQTTAKPVNVVIDMTAECYRRNDDFKRAGLEIIKRITELEKDHMVSLHLFWNTSALSPAQMRRKGKSSCTAIVKSVTIKNAGAMFSPARVSGGLTTAVFRVFAFLHYISCPDLPRSEYTEELGYMLPKSTSRKIAEKLFTNMEYFRIVDFM